MHRAANTLRRIGPGALLALLACAGCDNAIGLQQGYAPVQPIAYSHALHAGMYQMSCQYCHFGADSSRHAGVPPVNVCMNCHTKVLPESPEIKKLTAALESGKPIEWVKVHRLPDFAFFSHAAHVHNGGVVCQTCHGPVETMVRVEQVATMSMGWCLDCHRTTGADPAWKGPPPPTDCSACHR
jgi:hypothetical protein